MSPPDSRPGAPSPAPIWAALAASCALLFWIAGSASVLEGERGEAWHHYEYLVDGFLGGHASLSVRPAPQLLALSDPYNPDLNGRWRLWDASLYDGKFFLYFGPTPVLLMLPWRVLTGHHLPERLAAAAFGSAGVAALALLIAGARRRHFPTLAPLAAAAILFVAACASWLPVTLRRPEVWEVALVASCACLWWALYFLWRCLNAEGGAGWALGVGAAVALMLGSRPTGLFAGAATVVLLFDPRRPGDRRFYLAGAVAAAGGVALLAYNVARFGHPLEFGQSYQLWGSDERNVRHFSPAYAPYNAWLYLLSVPNLSPFFPFVLAVPPGGEPAGYVATDEMHGALFAVPIQLASLAALAWTWRHRRDPATAALRRTVWGASAASVFAAATLFCYAGSSSRYITELFAGSTVAASIGMMAIFTGAAGRARNVARLLAICAGAWTVGYVALASAEYRILFRKTNPATYRLAARLLDYPSLWFVRSHAVVFGPMALTVRLSPFKGPSSTVLISSGRPGMENQLVIERPAPGVIRLAFTENSFSAIAATPPLHVEGNVVRVEVEAPWLYPPPQHPWWDGIADPVLRRDLQTRFVASVGGIAAAAHTAAFFDPTRFEPAVTTRGAQGAGAAWVEAVGPFQAPGR